MKRIFVLILLAAFVFGSCKKKCNKGTFVFWNLTTTENIEITVNGTIPDGCGNLVIDGSCHTDLPSGDSIQYHVRGLTTGKISNNKLMVDDCVTHTINIR